MDAAKSIFEDDFFGPLLAKGIIPGAHLIPDRLAKAMAVLINRSIDGMIHPMECKGPAALVVLAADRGLLSLSLRDREPRAEATTSKKRHIGKSPVVSEEVLSLRAGYSKRKNR